MPPPPLAYFGPIMHSQYHETIPFNNLFMCVCVCVCMEFSRQENWSGLPFPPPGDLPNPRIKPGCRARQADSLLSDPAGKPSFYMC